MSDSDEALVQEARRGSPEAFEQLVRRHQGLVRNFLRRLCGNAALADDLAQEAFFAAWRKLRECDKAGSFRGWLCRIAYTTFLQQRRSAKAAAAREAAVMADAETTADPASASDARIDLDRVLALLTPEQAASLALCYGEGMSHSEAAEALGIPVGTLKSHVTRGRARALEALKEVTHGV